MVELDFEIKNKILNYLRSSDGASASDISKSIGHNRITIGKYLQILEAQKLVASKKVASAIFWQLANSFEKPKVLVVDDEPHIVELIKLSLDDTNVIYEAFDGEEAISSALRIIPDIIILDIMMPKKNGFEVCKFLKSNPLTKEIPILILSAKGSVEDKVKAMELGADDYVVKPFDPIELDARVASMIRKHRVAYEKNSITGLPNKLVSNEMESFWNKKKIWFETIVELEGFDDYVRINGHKKGSEIILILSRMLVAEVSDDIYLGHLDDNSFVLFSEEKINLKKIIEKKFNEMIPYFLVKKDTTKNNLKLTITYKKYLKK